MHQTDFNNYGGTQVECLNNQYKSSDKTLCHLQDHYAANKKVFEVSTCSAVMVTSKSSAYNGTFYKVLVLLVFEISVYK